jgi:hypothetical protein
MLDLVITKRTDKRLLERMSVHYSRPKGFVGRNICYAVLFDGEYYGHIVGGSATRFLPGKNEYLKIDISKLNNVVNNIFYNVRPVNDKYPVRNFTSFVLKAFMKKIKNDWFDRYGDEVLGFESLVEKPRTGKLYRRAGWALVGETKEYTCKREAGKSTDAWTGKRIWDKNNLRPKLVFCYSLL